MHSPNNTVYGYTARPAVPTKSLTTMPTTGSVPKAYFIALFCEAIMHGKAVLLYTAGVADF